jgi:hypothetical protein
VLISTDPCALGPGREPQYRGLCRGGIFAGREQPGPGGRVPWGMCVCTQHAAGDVGGGKKEKERGEGKTRQVHGSLWLSVVILIASLLSLSFFRPARRPATGSASDELLYGGKLMSGARQFRNFASVPAIDGELPSALSEFSVVPLALHRAAQSYEHHFIGCLKCSHVSRNQEAGRRFPPAPWGYVHIKQFGRCFTT